jgi:RHS repeat-associated protein
VWLWNHDPFGNGAPLGATYELRFPGQFFDQATGLHYNYFRDYDPRLGRYIESDPIGLAGGINTYAYAGSNPLTRIDPRGLTDLSQVIGRIVKWCMGNGDGPDDQCAADQSLLNMLRQQLMDVKPNFGGNVIPRPRSPGDLDVRFWNDEVREFNQRAQLHNQNCPANQVAPLDTITFN